MQPDAEEIQPGWTVWASDGTELGRVMSVEGGTIHIKKNGLLGGELTVPLSAVTDVETGRVEVSMTKEEVAARR
jgi:hypothetical protein